MRMEMTKLVLDSTQAKCFSNCKKKYYWNYVENLRKNEYEEDSVDLRFGSAIHSALELFNEHTTDTAPVLERFKSEFVDLPEEKVKTTEHGLLLLENFFPYYRANFSEWETLQTEETGHIDMGEIDYVVKIDRVVRWRGNIYVCDWKTTKSTRKAGFFDKFALDFQPTGYIKWCKEKYGECSGFLPVAMFMGYRSRAYKGEPAGFHCEFDYSIVNRTNEDIQMWEKDMLWLRDEIEQAELSGFWRRNPDHCSSYRGCQYSQLCQSCDDEMVKSTLYSQFDSSEYLGLKEGE
jgi:hypothetical protein